MPDEVIVRLKPDRLQAADALARRFHLVRLETQTLALTGASLVRWRIPDRRSVPTVVRALQRDGDVAAAQPNYIFALQDEAAPEGDPAQYALAKLHLAEAHRLATGKDVLIAVVDSAVDAAHPELGGAIADRFDAVGGADKPDPHGTAIAGTLVAHQRLMGVAPAAKILAVRAFVTTAGHTEGTTFNILKGVDWAGIHGARIVNMSFAGPSDPALAEELAAARHKGIVLVAAAGNAGPRSGPLFPAADPDVIAVTATDAQDQLFGAANRGRHIAVAAPGVEIFAAAPNGAYQVTSGTSLAAAHVSGVVALLLELQPALQPDDIRARLRSSATALGQQGGDDQSGAGLIDAYRAVSALTAKAADPAAENVQAGK